jgi:HAD superfamily hydrolase (TIGR01457 family)
MEKLRQKKLFILDLDGTIYLSDKLISGADEFINTLRQSGRDFIFLTNNSSRSGKIYVEKLKGLGIDIDESQVMTSGKATILYLKRLKPEAKIFLLGTPSLEEEFNNAGFTLIRDRNEKPDYVVFGFDKTLTYEKIWMACDFILEGAGYIATHPDLNCPLEGGKFMIDTGSFLKAIEASIQRTPDAIIGKPSKFIIDIIKEEKNALSEDLVMVGDRLYTDILGASNAGIDSVLVFSGETTRESYEKSEIKATFSVDSVAKITEILKNEEA